MGNSCSARNGDGLLESKTSKPQNRKTPEDGINWDNIPRIRKRRKTSLMACFFTSAAIIAYGFYAKEETTYKESTRTMNNKTGTLYKKKSTEPKLIPKYGCTYTLLQN